MARHDAMLPRKAAFKSTSFLRPMNQKHRRDWSVTIEPQGSSPPFFFRRHWVPSHSLSLPGISLCLRYMLCFPAFWLSSISNSFLTSREMASIPWFSVLSCLAIEQVLVGRHYQARIDEETMKELEEEGSGQDVFENLTV
jgi:hypothetical protein